MTGGWRLFGISVSPCNVQSVIGPRSLPFSATFGRLEGGSILVSLGEDVSKRLVNVVEWSSVYDIDLKEDLFDTVVARGCTHRISNAANLNASCIEVVKTANLIPRTISGYHDYSESDMRMHQIFLKANTRTKTRAEKMVQDPSDVMSASAAIEPYWLC